MAETPVPITVGNGTASIAADLVSGNLYQQIKVVDGTLGSNTALKVNADGSITASIYGNITVTPAANQSVSGTVGASVIGLTPVAVTNLQGASVSGTIGASILGAVNVQYANPGSLLQGVISAPITGIASVILLAAPPASQRNYISHLLVTNSAAVGTVVGLVDNGVVIYAGYAAPNGGGFSSSFPIPMQQPGTNKGLYVVSSVQASVYVSASGYIAT